MWPGRWWHRAAYGPAINTTVPATRHLTGLGCRDHPTVNPPGFSVAYVLDAFRAVGLRCDGGVESPIESGATFPPGTATYWKHPSGSVYLGLEVEGDAEEQVRRVEVSYKSLGGPASQTVSKTLLLLLAGLEYEGGDPDAARQWLEDSWEVARANGPIETDLGAGHFTLSLVDGGLGADYTLALEAAEGYLQ